MVTATEIRNLWEAELREEAERLDEPEPQPWEELAYMRWQLLRTSIPVIKPDPERTWLWSDLHLGDETFALLKRRPFPTTEDMDRELLASWRSTVRPDDFIICLGDVAVASFWTDPEHVNDVRSCPGRRLLIRGNHDVRQRKQLQAAGFTDQYWAVILDTDPPAAVTHLPLRRRPVPAVNIHGHLHGEDDATERHANVTVERTGYKPVRLDEVLERVRRPLPTGK